MLAAVLGPVPELIHLLPTACFALNKNNLFLQYFAFFYLCFISVTTSFLHAGRLVRIPQAWPPPVAGSDTFKAAAHAVRGAPKRQVPSLCRVGPASLTRFLLAKANTGK